MNVRPPYSVVPVAESELVGARPELAETLNQLAPLFNDASTSSLSAQVDREGIRANTVARNNLRDNGVISPD